MIVIVLLYLFGVLMIVSEFCFIVVVIVVFICCWWIVLGWGDGGWNWIVGFGFVECMGGDMF